MCAKTLGSIRSLVTLQGGLDPKKISGVGTNFGLRVHVLPEPKKRRVGKYIIDLS